MTTSDFVSAQPVSFLEQARREARERQQRSAEQRARELAQRREDADRRDRDRFEALQSALDQSVGRSGTDEFIDGFEEPTYATDSEARWVTKIPRISLVWRTRPGINSQGMYEIQTVLSLELHGHGGSSEGLALPEKREHVLDLVGRAVELEEARRAVAVSRAIENFNTLARDPIEPSDMKSAKEWLQIFCNAWGPDGQVDAAFTKCMAVLQDAEDKRVAALKARDERQARMWWNFKAWRITYGVKGKKGERWRTGHAWAIAPTAEQDQNGRGWYRSWDLQASKWIRVFYAMVLSIEEHSFDMAAARNERLYVELEDGLILPPPGTEEQPA